MYCGKLVKHLPNNNKNIIGFCCKHCLQQKFNKPININSGGMVVKKCEQCGNLFVCDNFSDISRNHRFCSRNCNALNSKLTHRCKKPVEKRKLVDKICAYCGKHYKVHMYRSANSRYCSKKCFYADGKQIFTCQLCGKTYQEEKNVVKNNIIRQKFCPNCRHLHSISAFEIDVYDELCKYLPKRELLQNKKN